MIKVGDSVYVYSNNIISQMIVWVSTGGKYTKNLPSHEARIYDITEDRIKLIEVIWTGKRFYYLDDYIKLKAQIWIKRDNLTENKMHKLIDYLDNLKVRKYDWGLIFGFLARFILRKLFPRRLNWNWVTKLWDNRACFVCSEYQNAGRRFVGMNIKENETPYDNFRKIPAQEITTYNLT